MKRIVAGMTAVILTGAFAGLGTQDIIPKNAYAVTAYAADALQTRDIWCANEDVNRWESEHFQFIWGKNGADSAKITQEFLEENAKHMEACWSIYMNDLSMEPPTQSVDLALRDGNQYKLNIYLSGTGLSRFTDDWAYMGYDDQGYAFMFCCVGAMQNSPNPSWVLPHEFGHAVTAHQRGWNSNKYVNAWWEAIANWYREQFLYSEYYQPWADVNGVTDYFETYMKNLCFTPILGRDNYASWFFLQYLTENPDQLPGYGSSFIKELMQQGQPNEYPYSEIERLSGADIKDTLGHYAKRIATLDLKHKADYQTRQSELLARGVWNWNQIFTILEQSGKSADTYTVPTERAPQQFGVNVIPLQVTDDKIRISLTGMTNVKGADWRACIVVESKDGNTRYSDLFKSGETAEIAFDAKKDAAAYLTVTATPDSDTWQKIGVPWAYSEGEFDENNYPHLSKTRYPYAVTISGAEMKPEMEQAAASSGHYHANGGGFVASTANVADTAYVGKNARVLGYATVSDHAVIDGHAVVTDNASVSGNAVVNGYAVVAERAKVQGNAIISDRAGVMGNAVISDNARVLESGLVYDNYTVSENATVKGTAFCMVNGAAKGQAMPDGDYYDDSSRTIQAGSVYGWTSPDAYVNSRPYNDGQYAGLEFDTDSSYLAADSFTSTFAMAQGAPLWESTRTSANGVLTFSKKEQYLIADSSFAALHDGSYQTAVLVRDDGENEIFRFGNDSAYMQLTVNHGDVSFTISNGLDVSTIKAENSVTPGKWSVIGIDFSGDTAILSVNSGNGIKSERAEILTDPVEIMADDAVYLIGDGMNGSMDYFRVNFKSTELPEYGYTESEDKLIGDVNADGTFTVADIVLLQKWILNVPDTKLADWEAGNLCQDDTLDVLDLCLMKRMLLNP